ncbi:MAG: NUDIX hydrolase [Bacteroidota bacterium]
MWKKLSSQYAYKGWRHILKKQFQMPDGETAVFDVVDNNDYITVAAFTPEGAAILVRQFRPGPEQELLSFPEGYIDEGEAAEEAARRELLEETGYEAGSIRYLKTFRRAYSTETRICFLAENCRRKSQQDLDRQEFIEVLAMPRDAFRSMLQDEQENSFTNVDIAYLALDKMGLLS